MLVYYLLLVGSLAVGVPLCRLKHGKGVYCALAGTALFLTAALRSGVGYDYNLYGSWFVDYRLKLTSELGKFKQEKGFLIPMKFVSEVTDNYQVMFVIIAAVISTAVMLFIYFYCEKPYLGVFCFLSFGVFFNSMNFMRQMIAATIVLYAFQYIKKKQFFRFLVFVLLASAFHVSALIMVVFYFLLQIKMNWISLGVYSGLLVLFFIFSEKILNVITRYFYTGYKPGSSIEVSQGTMPIYAILFTLVFIVAFLLRKRLVESDSFNNVFLNCMFFVCFFELMGIKHGIVSRFSVLFLIPAVTVLVPKTLTTLVEFCKEKFAKDKVKQSTTKAVAVAVFITFCTGMYSYMIFNNYNGVYPYKTVISERGSDDAEQ